MNYYYFLKKRFFSFLHFRFRERVFLGFISCMRKMNEKFNKLCVVILVLLNLNKRSQATWYETVDINGQKKIQHTIPRLKRMPESLMTDDYVSSSEIEQPLVSTTTTSSFEK